MLDQDFFTFWREGANNIQGEAANSAANSGMSNHRRTHNHHGHSQLPASLRCPMYTHTSAHNVIFKKNRHEG